MSSRPENARTGPGSRQLACEGPALREDPVDASVFADAANRDELFTTKMKQDSAGGRLVENLRAHGGHGERLRDASLDRSRADRATARRHCPQEELFFEKFPVIQLANDAVDWIPPARGEGPAVGGRTEGKAFLYGGRIRALSPSPRRHGSGP